jgi:hypothetical protein
MVADIARVTYDRTRQYHFPIYQQGRVTLEADNNEATTLASEALRLETVDIIGPTGAVGDGYEVGPGTGPDGVTIHAGTFYLGGWRLELDKAIDISPQTDKDGISEGYFAVALLLTEQSVCAVEDQALREVALGGPDTAARMRLMQKFLRIPVKGDTCAEAKATVLGLLEKQGIKRLDHTLQLISAATLKVAFVQGPPSTDPCTPAAAGGYLGADNQMVRVTVTEFSGNSGKLLWGWNDASLLYRANCTNATTLTLVNTPVDQEHAPQPKQWVEILRTELALDDDGNFVAEQQGFVTSVPLGYSSASQQIVLNDPLPQPYQNNRNPLYVRLWQSSVPFSVNTPTPLDNVSGITVTISMPSTVTLPAAGTIVARPFWHFAVRPLASTNIFPQRYLENAQPPDGPRQWITDLAVMEALVREQKPKLQADCRVPFLPLTKQNDSSCCGLVLGPDDVVARGGLQAVVDALAGAPAVLSLRPGTYPLSAPLQLVAKHAGLTIEACGGAVTLTAAGSDLTPFRLGLIVFNSVKNITLRDLAFTAPVVPVAPAKDAMTETSTAATVCGLLVGDANALTIEGCCFALTAIVSDTFGGAIVVLGATTNVELRRNRFIGAGGGAAVCGVLAWVDETNAGTEFDQWTIRDNRFDTLAFGAFVYAQLGLVSCRDNVAVGCSTGFVFVEANLGVTSTVIYEAQSPSEPTYNADFAQKLNGALRPDILTGLVAKGAPILAALPPAATAPATVSDVARKALADQLKTRGVTAYKALAATLTTGADTAKADAAKVDTAPLTVDTAAYDHLNAISVASELQQGDLTPALRIEDNEVTLSTTAPWVGIAVILSPDEPGSVIVSGNRVETPDTTICACSLLLLASGVVTGNLFVQLAAAPARAATLPSLVVLTASPFIMVSSNVVALTSEYVLPTRTLPPAAGWDFLNTVI